VVAVSEEDGRMIREEYGGCRVDVVDNGIDRDSFAGLANRGDPRRILFLGSLDYRPNQDAVAILLDRIFPAVRARVPDARLILVGRRPPPEMADRVARADGVELHADVPDVGPHLTGSGILAVPLRIGGGSRLKILEAMAVGLPVISTRVGAEGLDARDGEHLTIADEPEAMAAALVAAIRDPGPSRAMAEKARKLAWERYDWDVLADRLEDSWRACLDEHARGRGGRP
jgi:glycosyltransferase involved in cell wall biosynthesis